MPFPTNIPLTIMLPTTQYYAAKMFWYKKKSKEKISQNDQTITSGTSCISYGKNKCESTMYPASANEKPNKNNGKPTLQNESFTETICMSEIEILQNMKVLSEKQHNTARQNINILANMHKSNIKIVLLTSSRSNLTSLLKQIKADEKADDEVVLRFLSCPSPMGTSLITLSANSKTSNLQRSPNVCVNFNISKSFNWQIDVGREISSFSFNNSSRRKFKLPRQLGNCDNLLPLTDNICKFETGALFTLRTEEQMKNPVYLHQFGVHQHNYPAYNHDINAAVFLGSIKKRCRDEVEPLPSISYMKKRYPDLDKPLPALPKTRRDINIPEEFRRTTANEEFLLADDGDNEKILLFSTNDNLVHLAAPETFYCDGTFYSSPDLFCQHYTVHRFQAENAIKIIQLAAGGKRIRKEKYRDLEIRLQHLKDRFELKKYDGLN
ncbi:hypothetical protein KUTeg_009248 [Tegillarca granosa]|uniref:Uncharacterized protein n=1 Tax=Tegillarca granosa TaxID=220873 RepID=A0ABQ9FC33_TEGGR|nr:hypothetical protein KUTeg_009248 [Tegillarca granosa]